MARPGARTSPFSRPLRRSPFAGGSSWITRNETRIVWSARIAQELPGLLGELAGRGWALGELALGLGLDPGPSFEGRAAGTVWHREWIRPAAPTLDAGQLMELIRLRLESIPLGRGVCEVVLQARLDRSPREQHTLFPDEARRPRHAAGRALARLRAAFGEAAVVRARLREAHLPEAQFTWEPLLDLPEARPQAVWAGALVRRIYLEPRLLPEEFAVGSGAGDPGRDRTQPGSPSAALQWDGPYPVSGGWWVREVQRDYYFVHVSVHAPVHTPVNAPVHAPVHAHVNAPAPASVHAPVHVSVHAPVHAHVNAPGEAPVNASAPAAGREVLWVFWDRVRRQWYLQGRLE